MPVTIGDTITDVHTGATFVVTRHDPRDHQCWRCGGLVRVWTRYTLARPKVSGPDAYDQSVDSHHLLATGLLGNCPAATTTTNGS